MATVEDTSDPNPPDIRPFSRTPQPSNELHNPPSRAVDDATQRVRATGPSTRARATLRSTRTTALALAPLLALIVFATLPVATAQHARLDDPFTSPPDTYMPVYGGGARAHDRDRPTPIFNLVKGAAGWLFATTASAFGYELVPATRSSHMAKRGASTEHIVEAVMIPVLVALSGMFAGLTLGYFSVDPTQLHVLSISGTPAQQEYARKILPVRANSHLLLTTLVLGNMIVNEALPVITDGVLGGGIVAVVISTALVVIFAEIIPQSVCSRHGLLIGAKMAPVVRVLIWFFFPLGWPIAKFLEWILGAHHGIIYRRAELRELIKMHAASGEGGGDLDNDTITMAQGALDLGTKTVKDAMTPIDDVFMLPIDAKLDYETLGRVVRSGHSRIPVYQMVEVPDIDLTKPTVGPNKTKLVKKIMGSMLVKSCVLLDPEDATPLATIPINAIPSVPWNEPLTNMLNAFQEGRSHMAIVSRRARPPPDVEDAESVMTAAAGGLKSKFMRHVHTIGHKSSSGSDSGSTDSDSDSDVELGKKKNHRRVFQRRKSVSTANSSPTEPTAAEKVKAETEEKKKSTLLSAAKLNDNEQNVPADAELSNKHLEQFFDGLEGAPFGIITLEDVLEELIGEEIYDEYDKEGGPPSAASQFVPREAALAARKAALEREKAAALATAAATPLPPTGDVDVEQPAVAPSATKRVMTAIPKMPRFNITKSRSQPGRPRGELPEKTLPIKRSTSPVPTLKNEETDAAISPTPISTGADKSVTIDTVPTTIPPRLNSGSGEGSLSNPASSTNLLAEAVMIERGRRRLAATGSAPPGLLRASSTTGIVRPTPQRTGTPPSGISPAAAAAVAAPAAAASGRRTPMFKSTPLSMSSSSSSQVASAPPTAQPVFDLGADIAPETDTNEPKEPKDEQPM